MQLTSPQVPRPLGRRLSAADFEELLDRRAWCPARLALVRGPDLPV